MKMPNCTDIVSTKSLWEIAIEFLRHVDKNLMEYNLKLAYIVYLLCKAEHLSSKKTNLMVLLSCFNDIGKLHVRKNHSTPEVETYLFLKYFSPIKDFAAILIDQNHKKLVKDGKTFFLAKEFTTFLVEQNDKDQAFYCVDKRKCDPKDYKALQKIVSKTNLEYELNSMHYKTIVYSLIRTMIFKSKERDDLLIMCSSLFEMYSIQTLYHSKVTAMIAYMIAKYSHLPKDICAKIYMAGMVHDLGKVQVPLDILEKPGKLTDDEYIIMKTHVKYTVELLTHNMDFDIVEIAGRHHERLDGYGYPNHIDGFHLTLPQEIMQVADVISALIAKRSYKEAWSIDKTLAVLDENVKDNKLAIEPIEVFKDHQKKILKASQKYMQRADGVYDKINKERDYLINEKHLGQNSKEA
ncbi:MAG: HD domain-containing protein [Acholeplasmatales bacterium]|nr:HD domain-containing protein [Acholeplasmatales bacterium]